MEVLFGTRASNLALIVKRSFASRLFLFDFVSGHL